jgi:hypothetical protein
MSAWLCSHALWLTHTGTAIFSGGAGALVHKFWEPLKEKFLTDAWLEAQKIWVLVKAWLNGEVEILGHEVKTEAENMAKQTSSTGQTPQKPLPTPATPAPAVPATPAPAVPATPPTPSAPPVPLVPTPVAMTTSPIPTNPPAPPISSDKQDLPPGGTNLRKGAGGQPSRGIGGGGTNLRKNRRG